MVNEYHKVFNRSEYDNICSMCRNAAIGCTACKKKLAEVLDQKLSLIREKRKALEAKPQVIREILQHGCDIAKSQGAKTLAEVKGAMSISYFDIEKFKPTLLLFSR